MKVWNQAADQFVTFERWMKHCPWFWITTEQRKIIEEQN